MTSATEYQHRLGERLRAIRAQQDLTLQDVQQHSGGHWKAVVVGSYERGDRAVSLAKLAELADFYGVPVGELLPEPDIDEPQPEPTRPRVALDLTRLHEHEVEPRFRPVSRYAGTIQAQRGDYNGRVLTLRQTDLRSLAALYGTTSEELVERLDERGLLADVR
ncbi:MAG: transcriptional regulator [Actinobacteria bacterium]|nr:transcriptional regulator [Actinomycetota bacterium]